MSFTHLHVHTEFSLLDGANRISGMMEHIKEIGQNSVAITDHGVMYGVIDFYRAAKNAGIKPIIGCEVYVAPHSRFDKIHGEDRNPYHLILLCKNQKGYRNLIHMVSLSFSEGFYNRPRIDKQLLREYSEGLICLSACIAGEIPRQLLQNNYEGAKRSAQEYLDIFGEDFYIEVQDHGLPEQKDTNPQLFRIAQELNIPVVATNDAHYTSRKDAYIQDVLMCIQTGHTIEEPDRMRFETDEFYLKSEQEMAELFPDRPDVLENTQRIAEKCNLEFEFGKYHLPKYDVPEGYTAEEYLHKLCGEGLERLYGNDAEKRERMEYELDMISKMGFVDYFLIVWDFIHFAKTNNIPVGPGRGSAAGSIVAYCLGITTIDPLKYSLYFERFLNPERVSMPDIDVDFCYERRPEVIEYVTRKYGADHVAQIVTFGTLAARNAVRDVGRALNLPYGDVDAVAKMIPNNELHMTIDRAMNASEQLRQKYESDANIKRLIDTAKAIEGMPRHASTHAAGVVITNEPVDHYVPLASNDGNMVTQFVMTTLEELGLLKMDFLGLRTLTVLSDAERMVKKEHPDFCLEDVSLDDEKTYQMLSQGKTSGVFQLESTGITNVVTGLKPHSIEDITAVVALYRPGPMQSIPRYIACKHDPSQVKYKHPMLKDILDVTYGCMVYQEQVMEIFRVMAGYSLGKADMVRRAMSKKKMKELAKERTNFIYGNKELGIDGAVNRGVSEKIAESLFDEIMDFANYAFNKAHAVCYAVVSFQTAYMKCHYPSQYMAALMTSVLDSYGKVAGYIMECRSMGIKVLAPDINESCEGFTANSSDGSIRFGLAAIRNVGRSFLRILEDERRENGKFLSFEDFCERMYGNDLNKRALEGLIKAGAFDSMGYQRNQLLQVYENVLNSAANNRRKNIEGQMDLFGMSEETKRETILYPAMPPLSRRELLSMEKETTKMYLSGHPMDDYTELTKKAECALIKDIEEDLSGENNQPAYHDGMNVILCCVITEVRLKTTRNNSMMAYVSAEDVTGSLEFVVFNKTMQQAGDTLKEDNAVIIAGRIDAREDEAPKIIVSAMYPLEEQYIKKAKESFGGTRKNKQQSDSQYSQRQSQGSNIFPLPDGQPCPRRLYLRVNGMDDERLEQIKPLLSSHNGDLPVILFDASSRKRYMAPRSMWVYNNLRLFDKLMFILGRENVIIK